MRSEIQAENLGRARNVGQGVGLQRFGHGSASDRESCCSIWHYVCRSSWKGARDECRSVGNGLGCWSSDSRQAASVQELLDGSGRVRHRRKASGEGSVDVASDRVVHDCARSARNCLKRARDN